MNKKPDYSSFFYFNPLPSWVYDLDSFKILDVNQAAINHYGYTKQEFLSLTIKDLHLKEEIPKLLAVHTDIEKQNGNIYFGVFSHKKKNGDLIRMNINGHKVDYLIIESMMIVGNDVTIEEGKIKKLKNFEEKLNAVCGIAKLGYWRLELNGNTLTWTDEIYHIWGREQHTFDLNYETFYLTIHPDDRAAFDEEQRAAFAGEKEHNIVLRILLPDSRIRWVHELGRLVKDEQGKPIAFEGTVQDVTARKEEEQRLKLLESVVTNTNDAILITEAEHFDEPGPRIIYINEAFTKMTGYTPNEVIGKSPRMLQGPNSSREELTRLGKALRNMESCEITTVNYKKNGEEFWININVSPVTDEKGSCTHFIAVERDVTEQKQKELEKELISKISLDFSFENDLSNAASSVCKTVSEFGKFDFVEIWNVNLNKSQLQLFTHFIKDSIEEDFYQNNKGITKFKLLEGLPGKVWAKQSQLLWTDVDIDNDFIRKDVAKNLGLKAVMGIPLLFNTMVVGVLVIGTKQDLNHLKKYAKIFQQLEAFIGSEMNRKKLETELSHLYEAIPDILCLSDLKGRFLKINKAGFELLGYSEDEILYHSFDEFVHPEDVNISTDVLNKLLDGQTTFKFENRYLTKKEDIIWLSWTCNSALHEGLIYATAKNITEEKKLRELNRQANTMAKIGSWEVNLIEKKIFWTDMVHRIHDTDPATFVPNLESSIHFYHSDFQEMVQSNVEKCISTGEGFDFEAIIVSAKNKERWVRAIGNTEFIDGQCKRIYGSFQDIDEQKLNEKALQKSLKALEDYKFSLNQSAIIVFTDNKGIITSVNENFSKISKYSKEEIIGKTHQIINSKHHSKAFFADLWRTIASGKVWRGEIKNLAKDGSYYWEYSTIVPFLDERNKPFQYLAIRFDITDRKLADSKAIRVLEEKNNILESIGDAFFAVDKNWTVTYWNKEAENYLRIKREEILGNNLWDIFVVSNNSEFYQQNHKAMGTNETLSFEEYYPDLKMWFEISIFPSNYGLSIYFKDATLRKEADIRLQYANERFEMATEATNDVIWDWDLVNKIFYRSDGIERFFGEQTSKSLIEKDFWKDTFHPEYLPKIKESINKAIDDPLCNRWEMEYIVTNENGETMYVMDRGLILRDKKGKATRMVGAMTDITERKSFEKQLLDLNDSLKKYASELELSNEELEQFAFIASHDLQEPLRMISSFMDQLKRKYGGQLDDKALQYIHYATDGAKRMKQIILDLLEYSRAGKWTDSTEKVNLNELLKDYQLLRRKVIKEKSAEINVGELPVIESFRAPLTQAFQGLLDNAIHYSKEVQPPQIIISARDLGDSWEISLSDNGIGIDPKFHEKIFIIFQRLHNRDQYSGTGIGLSIAKRHIESWGGKIWLESEPGKGSVFYFTHPKKMK